MVTLRKLELTLSMEFGGVHDPADGAAIVEQLGHMAPVSYPYVNGSGINAPGDPETLKFGSVKKSV